MVQGSELGKGGSRRTRDVGSGGEGGKTNQGGEFHGTEVHRQHDNRVVVRRKKEVICILCDIQHSIFKNNC